MILVDAKCSILPERQSDFTREVRQIIPTVRREDGCTRYELLADESQPGIFHFLEEWESQAHLDPTSRSLICRNILQKPRHGIRPRQS